MAGRHRSRNKSIQIIRTATVAAKDCKRVTTTQFHVSYLNIVLLPRHSVIICNCVRIAFDSCLLGYSVVGGVRKS